MFNSSFRYWTSSRISSSDHLRVAKFFANGRSLATSIAGKFSAGAFVTRFYAFLMLIRSGETMSYPERCYDHSDNILFYSVLCNLYQSRYDIILPIFNDHQEIYAIMEGKDVLVNLFCDILLKWKQPYAESNLIAHLGTRVTVQNFNETEFDQTLQRIQYSRTRFTLRWSLANSRLLVDSLAVKVKIQDIALRRHACL